MGNPEIQESLDTRHKMKAYKTKLISTAHTTKNDEQHEPKCLRKVSSSCFILYDNRSVAPSQVREKEHCIHPVNDFCK
jgi:hypothetical protein